MHIGTRLRDVSTEERSACPATMRQAIINARAPIEAWRAGAIGQSLEQKLGHCLTLPEEEKRQGFSDVLRDHVNWLPAYLAALFDHATCNPLWQLPLTDVETSRQTVLYLVERADVKLSLVLLKSGQSQTFALPKAVQLSSGHVMLLPVSGSAPLRLRRWRKTIEGKGVSLNQAPDSIVGPAQPYCCTLSREFIDPLPDQPTLLLRLEWPEEADSVEQFFDAVTGAPLPHRLGRVGFRRHLALSTLAAIAPSKAAQHLPVAIDNAADDSLAWHYTRQLLSVAPSLALPILEMQSRRSNAQLRALAAQTLTVLREHYATLFEAA